MGDPENSQSLDPGESPVDGHTRKRQAYLQARPHEVLALTGHTACCAASVAVQRIVRRDRLIENVVALRRRLRSLLAEATAGIDEVGDIRGRGFFAGVELVADAKTKAPFPAAGRLYLTVREESFARGQICYPCGGNVNGLDGDTVIFSLPYMATEADLNEIAASFGEELRAALSRVGW